MDDRENLKEQIRWKNERIATLEERVKALQERTEELETQNAALGRELGRLREERSLKALTS
ncbi:MAG: hypothetical protein ISS36_00760 [Candidatus Aenigmarchaeota archaeon]|nr:hypothetical protein [Candidatus Aenigmarchaeota archaeon]